MTIKEIWTKNENKKSAITLVRAYDQLFGPYFHTVIEKVYEYRCMSSYFVLKSAGVRWKQISLILNIPSICEKIVFFEPAQRHYGNGTILAL